MEQHIIRQREFMDIIKSHLLWVATQGERGEKADFSGCIIEDVHVGQNVPDDAPHLVLSDISWRNATIRHSDFHHLLLSHNDLAGLRCFDVTVTDSIANMCMARGFQADGCGFYGNSLYADNLDESVIQNSTQWDNTISSCSLRDSYRFNNQIVGTGNRMEDCNCNGQTLEKVFITPYNNGDVCVEPRVMIERCSSKGGGIKNCSLPYMTVQDVSLDGKFIYESNFNTSTFVRTPTDCALIGANNFELTNFIQSPHTEDFVPLSIRLKNQTVPVAYYPKADQLTSFGIFKYKRLTPEEGIAELKKHPPKHLSKDAIRRVISGLRIIHSHRRQMINELDKLKGR